MVTIKDIKIRKILNSSGNWTLEIDLISSSGIIASASVPQGKSKGQFEAEYVNVNTAISNTEIIKKLINKKFNSIQDFDKKLIDIDGTKRKSGLGANLILSFSIGFTKVFAAEQKKETYEYLSQEYGIKPKVPQFSLLIFEGGKHGSEHISIQEFMLITNDIEESRSIVKTFEKYLRDNNLFVGYGAEGAFTSSKLNDIDVLNLLKSIAPNKQIALDIAESSREGEPLDYDSIINTYNILSIEDPKNENDTLGWKDFFEKYGKKIIVIADDLTISNKTLIANAQRENLANAVIIKPNQIGTVSETIEAVKTARDKDWKIIVSHRGEDTNDDFIADLAVGVGADYVKFGGLQRGERIAKYNRILEITNKLRN